MESRCGQNDSALKGGRQQLHCVFCTLGRIFPNNIMYMIADILTLCVLVTFFKLVIIVLISVFLYIVVRSLKTVEKVN